MAMAHGLLLGHYQFGGAVSATIVSPPSSSTDIKPLVLPWEKNKILIYPFKRDSLYNNG
jgi:hypothetical protein